MTRCFWLEPSHLTRVWLRRYPRNTPDQCAVNPNGYHSAMTLVGDLPARFVTASDGSRILGAVDLEVADDDPRWPAGCACGHTFVDDDHRQVFQRLLYRRVDTGALTTVEDAPPGAMFDAWWITWRRGPDGRSLTVKLPDTTLWHVDDRARNCGRPDDDTHRCWVRHGEPPLVTVDKNGDTCPAGAGSIASPGWHGFLRAGQLVT